MSMDHGGNMMELPVTQKNELKFKVGDNVRLVCKYTDEVNSYILDAKILEIGKVYVIDKVYPVVTKEIIFPYHLKGTDYNVEEHMLELVEEDKTSEEYGLPTQKEDHPSSNWTDEHYNFFYTLTDDNILHKKIKIDPYFVAKQWKIGSKDDSGALWHCFKTIARFGEKNSVEREIKALHAQIVRLAELHNVKL